jgi:hypothetical protein
MNNENFWKPIAIVLIIILILLVVSWTSYGFGKTDSEKETATYQVKTGNILLLNNNSEIIEVHVNQICQNIINQQIITEQNRQEQEQ